MVKIIYKPDPVKVKFDVLEVGEYFLYAEKLYLKIPRCSVGNSKKDILLVSTGEFMQVPKDLRVEPVDVVITVKGKTNA